MLKRTAALIAALVLTGCTSYTPQRYAIAADNNVALKALRSGGVGVGTFKGLTGIDTSCRGAGGWITMPDGMTFEGYLQKALSDELKVAGMFESNAPKVTLTGEIQKLEFSSRIGLSTKGFWDIGLRVSSSNGKTLSVAERYEFESAWGAETACKQTAEAYLPAVQNLVGKVIAAPGFKEMLSP